MVASGPAALRVGLRISTRNTPRSTHFLTVPASVLLSFCAWSLGNSPCSITVNRRRSMATARTPAHANDSDNVSSAKPSSSINHASSRGTMASSNSSLAMARPR